MYVSDELDAVGQVVLEEIGNVSGHEGLGVGVEGVGGQLLHNAHHPYCAPCVQTHHLQGGGLWVSMWWVWVSMWWVWVSMGGYGWVWVGMWWLIGWVCGGLLGGYDWACGGLLGGYG